MRLQGLPDFHQPIQAGVVQIFYPFEGGHTYTLAPTGLQIADRPPKGLDFQLELVTGQTVQPYGLLDFRVRPDYPMAVGLQYVRDRDPGATLLPANFSAGFLRLTPKGSIDPIPPDLLQPVPLGWNGIDLARYLLKLSKTNAVFVSNCLQEQTLPFAAAAELEMEGVSPRLPVTVRLNPIALLKALLQLADAEGRVTRDAIVQFFRRDVTALPLEVVGTLAPEQLEEFAEAMTDRVRVQFGQFIPSPEPFAKPYLRLAAPSTLSGDRAEWNLAKPMRVPRPLVLMLDSFAAAIQLVQGQGLSAVLRETIVPSFPTGAVPVSILTSLLPNRVGILKLGVTLRVPPRLPQRPQAITVSVELKLPQDTATALLRLSPTEPLQYTASTFVVLKDGTGIQRLNGPELPYDSDMLTLYPDTFAVDFVQVEAAPELLQLASIHGVCRRLRQDELIEQAFSLELERSGVAIALPAHTDTASLEFELIAKTDSSKTLKLGPLPAQDWYLGLYMLTEYGPQKLAIECLFGKRTTSVAIDLQPNSPPDMPQPITTLNFTPSKPRKEWFWFADSPFYSGYRYRLHRSGNQPPAAWSEWRSPTQSLYIHADTLETHHV